MKAYNTLHSTLGTRDRVVNNTKSVSAFKVKKKKCE